MHTNLGYLYIFDTTNATNVYGYGLEGRQGYLLTDTKYGFDVVHETKFKLLETVYENLFSANEYQKIFPLFLVCSLSVYFWMIVLMFFRMFELKNWRILPSMALIAVLGATSILAPCAFKPGPNVIKFTAKTAPAILQTTFPIFLICYPSISSYITLYYHFCAKR